MTQYIVQFTDSNDTSYPDQVVVATDAQSAVEIAAAQVFGRQYSVLTLGQGQHDVDWEAHVSRSSYNFWLDREDTDEEYPTPKFTFVNGHVLPYTQVSATVSHDTRG